jgi:hypothetical protein
MTNLQELTVENFLSLDQINPILSLSTELVFLKIKTEQDAGERRLDLTKLNKLQCLIIDSTTDPRRNSSEVLEFEISEKQVSSLTKVNVNHPNLSKTALQGLIRIFMTGNCKKFKILDVYSWLQLQRVPSQCNFT